MILLANLPHAIFSGLYLFYNNIYTRMLAELEWNRFSQRGTKEGILLRVTQPEGRQRSKYFLSLPYRYAIALMVQSIIVHWFVSQSLFFVSVRFYDHGVVKTNEISTLGFSPMAIVFSITAGLAMAFLLSGNAFRKYSPGTPFGGTCSAVISAACHPPNQNDKLGDDWGNEIRLEPVKWGVIGDPNRPVGHCGFGVGDVPLPTKGKWYAGQE